MTRSDDDVVIWGVTASARTFRPSDWAERLAGLTSAFGSDQRLMYSPHVLPMTISGVRALIVRHELATLSPRLHQFLLGFARDNELVVEHVRDASAAPHVLVPPGARRREPQEPV